MLPLKDTLHSVAPTDIYRRDASRENYREVWLKEQFTKMFEEGDKGRYKWNMLGEGVK